MHYIGYKQTSYDVISKFAETVLICMGAVTCNSRTEAKNFEQNSVTIYDAYENENTIARFPKLCSIIY